MSGRLLVVIVVLALGMVGFILSLVRRRQLKEKYAMLWLAVGFVALLFSAFGPLLDRFGRLLGIAYGPSALFLCSTLFLMLVAAHLSWEVSRLEERTRRLAEEVALLRADREPASGPSG